VLRWALDDGISGNDWAERNVPGKDIKKKAVRSERAGNMGEEKNTFEIFDSALASQRREEKRKRKEIPGKVDQQENRKEKRDEGEEILKVETRESNIIKLENNKAKRDGGKK
jgi:hypothetical protein